MAFGLSLGLGLGARSGTSLAAQVAALFGPSDLGVLLLPSDTATLFQDSAGTTPVTAAGQLVGRISDKSGRDNPATQATALSRPAYRETPSRIDLDAIDDNMSVNFGAAFSGTVLQ